jgi:hypothetical protein
MANNEKNTASGRIPSRPPLDEELVDPASALSFINVEEVDILEFLFGSKFSGTEPA